MESLFRRRFWIVHFAAILIAALLVMRVVSAGLEVAIAPRPEIRVPNAKAALPPRPPKQDLLLDRIAALTGLPLPKPEPTVTEPLVKVVDLTSEPVHTGLRVRLLGTLVNEADPDWSMASIQDATTQKSTTYMLHDLVLGAEIVGIERLRVVIIANNRREFIDAVLAEGGPPPPPPPVLSSAAQPASDAPKGQPASGIKQVAANKYEIPRGELDRTLSNLNDVAMQARIIPSFKDGQPQGFKLLSIRPDSIYSKIGIENGDVIRRINGFDINSPEKALEIYQQLKSASQVEIEVDRNGKPVSKSYTIQ